MTMECETCGESNDTVETTLDPYLLMSNNEEVEVTLCEECFGERAEEIENG